MAESAVVLFVLGEAMDRRQEAPVARQDWTRRS
jgi:hypothetical protein